MISTKKDGSAFQCGTVFLFLLIAWVLCDTEVFALQAVGDGLAVVLAAHVVVLGHEVVVHLLEVGFLIGSKGLLVLPVVGEVLVVLHLLDAADEVLPALAVQHRELFVGELIVPFALDLVEGGGADLGDAGTTAQLVEGLGGLAVTTQLHKGLGFGEQHFGIANLDAVDAVLLDLHHPFRIAMGL